MFDFTITGGITYISQLKKVWYFLQERYLIVTGLWKESV